MSEDQGVKEQEGGANDSFHTDNSMQFEDKEAEMEIEAQKALATLQVQQDDDLVSLAQTDVSMRLE